MTDLTLALEKLRSGVEFTPEYEGPAVSAAMREPYDDLLAEYPGLERLHTYLEFLRLTGGAHIHNQECSLVIYGLGGYVVPSLAEGWFLDKERYFLFGEVMYSARPDPVYFLAFDLKSKEDAVYISPDEESRYSWCSPSFIGLLLDFVAGRYPAAEGDQPLPPSSMSAE